MTGSLFAGLLLFSAVAAFTPGPNNMLALASGAAFGYARTLPHVIGVCLGFASMIVLVGLGLGGLLAAVPAAYLVLKYAAFAYLVYLAIRIARSAGIGEGEKTGKPITLLGSAAFQWINPKAWMAAVTLVASFTNPRAYWSSLAVGALANLVLAFLAVSLWALFGTVVKTWLSNSLRRRLFNWAMAAALVLSVLPALFSDAR